eukprot:gene4279-6062_t
MSTLMSKDLNITRPSTKLHAPPGGKSSFSLGGDEPVKVATKPTATIITQQENINRNPVKQVAPPPASVADNGNAAKSSIRVRQAPGGQSSIVIG